MPTITLTAAATAAAQFIGVLDSGESLSSAQLTDALNAANNLLYSWWQEQNQGVSILVSEQQKAGAVFVAQQAAAAVPLTTAYTLLGATYTAPTYTNPTYTPGAVPQFADNTTPITLPNGYDRALKLNLGIELAPQFDVIPSEALIKQAAEARAAASPMPGKIPIPGLSVQSEVS